MPRRSLLWRLYPAYLLITFGAVLAVSWYAWSALREFHHEMTRRDLEARAHLAERQLLPLVLEDGAETVDPLCKELGERTRTRFTVILPEGRVIGDSVESPARMDNHGERPEVVQALLGRTGTSTRYSRTLERSMMYVAVPARHEGRTVAVVRASTPLASLREALGPIYDEILLAGAVTALVAAAFALLVSRHVTGPMVLLHEGAERFARGELTHKVPAAGPREISSLAEALNLMAARLNNRIRKVVQQRNELKAVLGSMVEGVVAMDQDQRVIRMNPAGAELLGTDPDTAVGRTIQEVVRNPELQSVVAEALREEGTVEGDVTLPGQQEERSMRVRATTLRDADGKATGTLLVLQDVTRLRRLQQIRRDFVANVSHELRTPITAIKGFAETLLEEGGDEPEQRRRFLDIIARQANRLESIFEDLLSLSRAERLSERGAMELTMEPLEPVLESAVELVRRAAGDRGVAVEVDCPSDLTARINAALLEQAVFNLVDNAVRYSREGASVKVTARPSGKEVVISVRDTGPGIASEHLPRIFERFYRADRGRDRSSGGTGLGLAIVKHVAQSHGGRVSVESTPGRGSTFTIHLPAA